MHSFHTLFANNNYKSWKLILCCTTDYRITFGALFLFSVWSNVHGTHRHIIIPVLAWQEHHTKVSFTLQNKCSPTYTLYNTLSWQCWHFTLWKVTSSVGIETCPVGLYNVHLWLFLASEYNQTGPVFCKDIQDTLESPFDLDLMLWVAFCRFIELVISGEPEERYHYSMLFRWEPKEHYYPCTQMAIAPFWFSREHWRAFTPLWLSANDMNFFFFSSLFIDIFHRICTYRRPPDNF